MPKNNFNKKDKTDFKTLSSNLEKLRDETVNTFKETHQKAAQWIDDNQVEIKNIRKKSKSIVASASLAASLLLSPAPQSDILTSKEIKSKLLSHGYIGVDELENSVSTNLSSYIPDQSGHAPAKDETAISKIISDEFGIKAVPQYEGERLNHSIGWMGYEQHLKRFPGDTIHGHDEEQQAGIAPGLGAWGYFAYSSEDFDHEDEMKEKYYFAVQTLYLPNWKSDLSRLVKWYKHRKMIAINPDNGKAVVGVIADAGPAKFTGKHFGGSPEVMAHLELIYGKKKGKVILYFVDDPDNQIPLGPVQNNYQIAQIQEI
jgi:hypothetical protein